MNAYVNKYTVTLAAHIAPTSHQCEPRAINSNQPFTFTAIHFCVRVLNSYYFAFLALVLYFDIEGNVCKYTLTHLIAKRQRIFMIISDAYVSIYSTQCYCVCVHKN